MKDPTSSEQSSTLPLVCPSCHERLPSVSPLNFCLYCGAPVGLTTDKTAELAHTSVSTDTLHGDSGEVALVRGHTPGKEEVQFSIGPYQILSSIGKGGMGEVFLCYDTTCGRRIALKRIREDLAEKHLLYNRFLKEARITSQLMHPAIIPIYSIHAADELLYYTMPYVEGESLKQILRATRQQEKRGEAQHHLGGSIAALTRIFVSVCQAVAFAHDKGVLHRDLKPENVMVGRFGEVMILDWGLAKLLEGPLEADETQASSDSSPEGHPLRHLTNIGKVVGTIAYMSPERALGHPATVQTDIYALGVTLYQILTLHLPFKRETLRDFRQNMHKEVLLDPAEVAPYREVPPALSQICHKMLAPNPEQRYRAVADMIRDLEIFLEGRSEWFPLGSLDIQKKGDWEFQENVLIAEHVEITRNTVLSDWFSLMISRPSFPQNLQLQARVTLGPQSAGLGLLMNVPEAPERRHLIDGYCLWLGSEGDRDTKLLRSNVEVMRASDTFLQTGVTYQVRLEKIDNNIHVYLNDQLQLSFISHLPLAGTHVGLLSRDLDFTIEDFTISGRSENLTVSCLAVPDAFLAHKDYQTALVEYRRIGYSFPGRAEGREALFRAGITLLERAKHSEDPIEADKYYEQALEEFAKLHSTPGAPLEYLGKAIVYQAQGDYEEEIKCFEMALRRYPQHPLLRAIQEHIAHRMHECSRRHRMATYNFVLLMVRHLPHMAAAANAQKLFDSLQQHWEPLPFLEPCPAEAPCEETKDRYLMVALAFWLAKPYVLTEIIEQVVAAPVADAVAIGNALFSLVELGCWKLADKTIHHLKTTVSKETLEGLQDTLELIQVAIGAHVQAVSDGIGRFLASGKIKLQGPEIRLAIHLLEEALDLGMASLAADFIQQLYELQITAKDRFTLQCYHIWAALQQNQWSLASEMLQHFPVAMLSNESSPLFFLYGCWLQASEGQEIAEVHFSGVLDTPYPRIWSLTSHHLINDIGEGSRWLSKAFLWEKRQLFRQLSLYYHCGGDAAASERFRKLSREQAIHISD